MLPKRTIFRVTAFADASDIRWRLLDYLAETDEYALQTTISGHVHLVERVVLHAWLRRGDLTRERPTRV